MEVKHPLNRSHSHGEHLHVVDADLYVLVVVVSCLQLDSVNKPIKDFAADEEEEAENAEKAEEEEVLTDTPTVSEEPIRGDYYRGLSDACIEIHGADTQMERLKVSRFLHLLFLNAP